VLRVQPEKKEALQKLLRESKRILLSLRS